MKRAARFINDTLFVSNFGSILVGVSKYDSTRGFPDFITVVFALFFLLFRIKTYLDDNDSLIKTEIKLNPTGSEALLPNASQKTSLIISFISWIFYSISGFYVFINLINALFFLSISLIVFILWILINYKKLKDEPNQKNYLWFNIGYLLCIVPLLIQMEWYTINIPCMEVVLILALLALVVVDYKVCNSLDNAFK